MIECGLYIAKNSFYKMIQSIGGNWNDRKIRPICCCIQSSEHEEMFWMVPMGNLDHRDQSGRDRIQRYIDLPSKDIQSCFYQVGLTNVDSIFFISKAIPICDSYIEREYLGIGGAIQLVDNASLVEIKRKLKRILAYERDKPNHFEQKITLIKAEILKTIANKV